MVALPFSQVDVFSATPFKGNPVAVVHDADSLSTERMASIARWTNLSETTFLLKPTQPEADYRLRIFTPESELPFAGHPTLGSAYAWLSKGGKPKSSHIVQECGLGLIYVRHEGAKLGFKAPKLLRSGEVAKEELDTVISALGVPPERVKETNWIDNGPGWMGLYLASAEDVLALKPDMAALGKYNVGVIGRHTDTGPSDYEVRAFVPSLAVPEDPVTGSLNAGLAEWLTRSNALPSNYTVRQGTALQREGDVSVVTDADGAIWISGQCTNTVEGNVIV